MRPLCATLINAKTKQDKLVVKKGSNGMIDGATDRMFVSWTDGLMDIWPGHLFGAHYHPLDGGQKYPRRQN